MVITTQIYTRSYHNRIISYHDHTIWTRCAPHLFVLGAGAATGAGHRVGLLRGRVEQLILGPPVQVLEVLQGPGRALVVHLVPPDVMVAVVVFPRGPPALLTAPPGGVLVVVVVVVVVVLLSLLLLLLLLLALAAVSVGLVVGVLLGGVPVAAAVRLVVVATVVLLAHGLVGGERRPLALRGEAVLAHLVHEQDLGHVVDDDHLGPVGHGLGLRAAEVDVHDEDGERGGGGDHGHGGDVVLP